MVKIQVEILDLLTARVDELAMEIDMRPDGACLRKHFDAQLDQYEPSLKVAPYLFLFTTRN